MKPVASAPQNDLYVVTLANGGATGAGPFETLFAPGGGASVQTASLDRLGAHDLAVLRFTGPACTAATAPTITVDPNDQVDDYNRRNNSQTVDCDADAVTGHAGGSAATGR